MRLAIAVVVGFALIATACTSDDDSGAGGPSETSTTTVGLEVDDVAEAAATYTGELGDEGAFAAVLIALDRGYAIDQLVPAVDLAVDGTIDAIDPANEPGGLVDLQAVSVGGEEESMGAGLEIALVSHQAAAPARGNNDEVDPRDAALFGLDLTIGEAHRRAAAAAYLEEMGFPEPPEGKLSGGSATVGGYWLVTAMMMLAARGYSAEQIVTALLTGNVQRDSIALCIRIPDEAPAIEVEEPPEGCPPLRAGGDGDTARSEAEPTPNEGANEGEPGDDDTQTSEPGGGAAQNDQPADEPSSGTVIALQGQLTGGPTVEGGGSVYVPIAVPVNRAEFEIGTESGDVTGMIEVTKEIDNSSGDCTSRYIISLTFELGGTIGDEPTMAAGTLDWGAVDRQVLQLDGTGGQCDAPAGSGPGARQDGTWEATWDAETGRLAGSMSTAAGTDTFEAQVVSVITDE